MRNEGNPASPGDEPSVEPSGDEVVDGALRELASLSTDAPLTEQLSVLTGVQETLHRRLTATDG
jgi:hypothetical protein